MLANVLLSPVGPSLHKKSYAKEYYLLQSIAREKPEVNFDGYVQRVNQKPPEDNLNTFEIMPNSVLSS